MRDIKRHRERTTRGRKGSLGNSYSTIICGMGLILPIQDLVLVGLGVVGLVLRKEIRKAAEVSSSLCVAGELLLFKCLLFLIFIDVGVAIVSFPLVVRGIGVVMGRSGMGADPATAARRVALGAPVPCAAIMLTCLIRVSGRLGEPLGALRWLVLVLVVVFAEFGR